MRTILLVAGEGRRLRPYTNDRPKSLVEVDGHSLLKRQLSVLNSLSINEILAVTGYKAEKLFGFNFSHFIENSRYAETNMVYSLMCAKQYFDQDILITYGDIVYSPEVLERLISTVGDLVVAVDKNWSEYWHKRSDEPLSDLESLKIGEDQNIIDIGNKVSSFSEIDGQYIGLVKISRRSLKFLSDSIETHGTTSSIFAGKTLENSYMTDMIQMMIDNGFTAKASFFSEPWVEVDTVEDLTSYETKSRLKLIEQNTKKFLKRVNKH